MEFMPLITTGILMRGKVQILAHFYVVSLPLDVKRVGREKNQQHQQNKTDVLAKLRRGKYSICTLSFS